MRTFEQFTNFLYYLKDSFLAPSMRIKIDKICFNAAQNQFDIVYRMGRQKLLSKDFIKDFSQKYFDALSNYDRHRLTKFLAFQNILDDLFKSESCQRADFIQYLKEEVKHEPSF